MCNLLANVHAWSWGSSSANPLMEPEKGTPCQCGVFLYNGFGKPPLPSKEFAQVFNLQFVDPSIPTLEDDKARMESMADGSAF